jgi:hypothetical protein
MIPPRGAALPTLPFIAEKQALEESPGSEGRQSVATHGRWVTSFLWSLATPPPHQTTGQLSWTCVVSLFIFTQPHTPQDGGLETVIAEISSETPRHRHPVLLTEEAKVFTLTHKAMHNLSLSPPSPHLLSHPYPLLALLRLHGPAPCSPKHQPGSCLRTFAQAVLSSSGMLFSVYDCWSHLPQPCSNVTSSAKLFLIILFQFL